VKPSRILLVALLTVAALYFLLPVYWLLVASTKSGADLFGSFGLWFSDPQWLHNLSQVFSYDDGVFWNWTWNSILYAGVGGALATLLACAAGYALAVYRFRGRETVFRVVLAGVLRTAASTPYGSAPCRSSSSPAASPTRNPSASAVWASSSGSAPAGTTCPAATRWTAAGALSSCSRRPPGTSAG
jgi:hypothetical protein